MNSTVYNGVDEAVAMTIVAQMGGLRRLQAMIGARQIVAGNDFVQFGFGGCRKANKCRIELDDNDTYTFQLWKYNKRTIECDLVHESAGVYADMLTEIFERETGLHLAI
jgi:hypothetical protein